MKFQSIVLIILTLLFSFCNKQTSVAENGNFSLEKWILNSASNSELNEIIRLDGEWEFYWKKFLLKEEDFIKEKPTFVNVPSTWNEYNSETKEFGGEGYGTFRLHLSHVPIGKILAFKVDDYATAFSLFINGNLIAKDGKVGNSHESMKPRTRPDVYYFYTTSDKLDIVIHVSNFYNAKGGFWHSLKLGTKEQIEKEWELKLVLEFFLIGSLFIMGLYSITLYSMIKKNSSSLFFGIFCMLALLRQLVSGNKYLLHIFPDTPWEFYMTLEYITMFMGVPIFTSYASSLFRKDYNRLAVKLFYAISLGFSLISIFTKSNVYTQIPDYFQVVIGISVVYNLFALFKAIYYKREGAKTFFIASFIFSVAVVNDIIYAREITSTGYILSIGIINVKR